MEQAALSQSKASKLSILKVWNAICGPNDHQRINESPEGRRCQLDEMAATMHISPISPHSSSTGKHEGVEGPKGNTSGPMEDRGSVSPSTDGDDNEDNENPTCQEASKGQSTQETGTLSLMRFLE